MAIVFKCKMCGGNLPLTEGSTIAECEYCGSVQTVPAADNDKKMTLFGRANRLRSGCEFDKAAGVYEAIVAEFPEEAEAYWGLVLCNYGIEYVDDPATGKKVPTCHRSSYSSILEDSDYEQALENADASARKLYREEAKQIEEIRKGIISVSANEEPYDIFICYKESAENGERTLDSVLAQDLYDELTRRDYRVFFARITLEDKLGMEYEPYIFAALNSAKIMLAVGTDYEYFNAVWVRNEWSRFLKLMAEDHTKHLIPCFKGIDAYDMPKEFARLQAQDLGKVGAVQDLLRGIEKLMPKKNTTVVKETAQYTGNPSVAPLLRRLEMFLADSDWDNAADYCEKILDNDPECAQAYVGKLLASSHCCNLDAFVSKRLAQTKDVKGVKKNALDDNALVERLVEQYVVPGYFEKEAILQALKQQDTSYISTLEARQKQRQEEPDKWEKNKFMAKALSFASEAYKAELLGAMQKVLTVMDQRLTAAKEEDETAKQATKQREEAEKQIAQRSKNNATMRNNIYRDLSNVSDVLAKTVSITDLENYRRKLLAMRGYQDSEKLAKEYGQAILRLKKQQEEQSMKAELLRRKRARRKEIARFSILGAVICAIILLIIWISILAPNVRLSKNKEALKQIEVGDLVNFGTYEQDGNIVNGKEEIEWLVLKVENGKALVVSKYVLDCQSYNSSDFGDEDVTWETCTLRSWLNDEFIDSAFSKNERAMIPSVEVVVDENSDYDSDSGNTTQDQIFLLSIAEVNKYFDSIDSRQCMSTEYALKNGIVSDSDNYIWWLRSSGFNHAATVLTDGIISTFGNSVTDRGIGVRPAMWIDINE